MGYRKLHFGIGIAILCNLVTLASIQGFLVKSKPPPCDSKIYCHGSLLEMVQLSHIYPDDKTFVDQPLKFSPEEVLGNFAKFHKAHPRPNKLQISKFVNDNFYANVGQEYQNWVPGDWQATPKFLLKIVDPQLRTWAATLHGFWKDLGRNISEDVRRQSERYSLVPVSQPFIVPGGRFREFYYWDSYWIQRGLLQSEMFQTVKGMIQNFLELVEKGGFVPNGGRIYYQRSQPPLLIQMVKAYFDATIDIDFVRYALPTLEKEFNFWIQHRMITVISRGYEFRVARYCSDKTGPRPESYSKDYDLAKHLKTKRAKEALYTNIQSAAESGWDFSSRWYIPEASVELGNTSNTATCHIIPVDLNAILYFNAKTMTKLYALAGDLRRGYVFIEHAKNLKRSLTNIFWDKTLGSYFDYDTKRKGRVTDFYASAFFPLWAEVDNSAKTVARVLQYLISKKIFEYPGGIPTSLHNSGQQWDFPNGWAPLIHIAIEGLAKSANRTAQDLSFELTKKWIGSNYKAFYRQTPNTMFEKYDVTKFGEPGSGGEYTVVTGFGWTNGVVLDLLGHYGNVLSL